MIYRMTSLGMLCVIGLSGQATACPSTPQCVVGARGNPCAAFGTPSTCILLASTPNVAFPTVRTPLGKAVWVRSIELPTMNSQLCDDVLLGTSSRAEWTETYSVGATVGYAVNATLEAKLDLKVKARWRIGVHRLEF